MEFVYLSDYPEAVPVVANWYFNQWGKQHGMNSHKEAQGKLEDYLTKNSLPLILLAKEGKEFLGAVQLKYYEMNIYPNKEHWLGGVFVPKEHRGRKIAQKLILRALKIAERYGIEVLYLQTEKLDGGLYKELGWKPIEEVKNRGKRVLVMKKFI